MALITCPDCSSEISDAALTCPKCGRPISNKSESDLNTIQETSKSLKLGSFLSEVIIWISVLVLFSSSKDSIVYLYACITLFIGIIMYLVNKINIWWHHK